MKSEKFQKILKRCGVFIKSSSFRRAIFLLFIIQAVILVFITKTGVPPDENNHIRFIEYYAQHSLDPIIEEQTSGFDKVADVTRQASYLYHYLMSLVYRISPLDAEGTYSVIRLFSVLLGLLTLIVTAKWLRRLAVPESAINIGLLLFSNMPSFLMVSAAVNNDPAVWLISSLGILMILRLWDKALLQDLLWLVILVASGSIVKRTFLPLAVVFALFGIFIVFKNYKNLLKQFKKPNWKLVLLTLGAVISIGFFTERIIGNLVEYKNIDLKCEQVHTDEQCRGHWLYERTRWLEDSKPENPDYIPAPIFAVRWFWSSVSNNINIQTQLWKHEVKPNFGFRIYLSILLFIAIVAGIIIEKRRFRKDEVARKRLFILTILIGYVFFHMFVNYRLYKRYAVYGLALNGRYLIPSLLPLTVFAVMYISQILKRWPRLLLVLSVATIGLFFFNSGIKLLLSNPQIWLGA